MSKTDGFINRLKIIMHVLNICRNYSQQLFSKFIVNNYVKIASEVVAFVAFEGISIWCVKYLRDVAFEKGFTKIEKYYKEVGFKKRLFYMDRKQNKHVRNVRIKLLNYQNYSLAISVLGGLLNIVFWGILERFVFDKYMIGEITKFVLQINFSTASILIFSYFLFLDKKKMFFLLKDVKKYLYKKRNFIYQQKKHKRIVNQLYQVIENTFPNKKQINYLEKEICLLKMRLLGLHLDLTTAMQNYSCIFLLLEDVEGGLHEMPVKAKRLMKFNLLQSMHCQSKKIFHQCQDNWIPSFFTTVIAYSSMPTNDQYPALSVQILKSNKQLSAHDLLYKFCKRFEYNKLN